MGSGVEPRAMGSRLTIRVPGDFRLARDVCSYGYFLLAPNRWYPDERVFERTLEVASERGPGIATTVRITQAGAPGGPLTVRCDRSLTRAQQAEVRGQIARMLRLDEDEAAVRAFHRVDPRWRRRGRARLFRSPTLFEDVIKTVTSCNVAWPNTRSMNERLCEVFGRRSPSGTWAFPSAGRLARARAGALRARCRVGYRDTRIVELAKLFRAGAVAEAELADPERSDDEVAKALLALPGIGPYASANIMQLLGRYARLALDTESVRHGVSVLGMTGEAPAVLKQLAAHYEPFGDQRFRSYWFELWADYEAKRGPAETWDYHATGSSFTAIHLRS